jgi:transposase
MSMRPMPWPEVPEQTAAVARAAFPKGSLAIRLRNDLGPIFQDTDFIGMFGVRGKPGIAPSLLMLVTVLQFVEQLTDRQAVASVAGRIDWKYALGLELDDPGFDNSVLAEFRARLVRNDLARLSFDRLLERCRELGLVKAGGKQRTDSTHVIAAVRDLNGMELAGETVRALVEALATVAPEFLAETVEIEEWARRYGPPVSAWRQPRTAAERDALTEQYGRDGRMLLGAIYGQHGEFAWLRELPQAAILCTVLRQTFLVETRGNGREVMRRREAKKDGVPPAHTRLASPYDTDARWAAKGTDLFWLGYKLHLTETCQDPAEDAANTERQAPNLITNVHTTDATVPDNAATVPIHQDLADRDLAPARHYLDSGYPSVPNMLAARREHGITMITPLLGDSSRQTKTGNGYSRDKFTIDYDTRSATCPQGQKSATWNHGVHDGIEKIYITFPQRACWTCDAQPECTTSKTRQRGLTVYPRELHEIQQAARTAQGTNTWRTDYRRRAGIEGTMNQAANTVGLRKARYRGLKKVELEHYMAATAINLIRLDAYLTDQPIDRGHTGRLLRLHAALTN